MRQWIGSAFVQIMACRLAKPLSKPTLVYCQLDPQIQTSVKFYSKFRTFHSRKCIWKCCLPKCRPFCPGEMSQLIVPCSKCGCGFKVVIFKLIIELLCWAFCIIIVRWMPQNSIGSGNGLVPSGNKPLPEPMLTRSPTPYGVTRPQ